MNNTKTPNLMDALHNAIEAVSGKEVADMWRNKPVETKVTPWDEWDIDDSDFEPDPYADIDEFGCEAAARDEIWHD